MNLLEYYREINENLNEALKETGVTSLEGWLKRKKSKKLRVGEIITYYLGQLNLINKLIEEIGDEEE